MGFIFMTTLNEGKIFGQVGLRYFGHGKEPAGEKEDQDEVQMLRGGDRQVQRTDG